MTPLPSFDALVARYGQVPDKKRRAAAAAAWVALLLAYGWFVAYPDVCTLDELSGLVSHAEHQKQEKDQFSRDYSRYEQELSTSRQRLLSAHDVLPDDPDVPQFLSKLGTMAHDLDVSIERLQPRAEQAKDFYAEIAVDVAVRGAFHQIATLIDQIGNQARIVAVHDVAFSEPKVAAEQISVQGHFVVTLYRFLTDQQIAELAHKEKKP